MKVLAVTAISTALWSGALAQSQGKGRKLGQPCALGVRVLDSIVEDQGPTYECFCDLQGADFNPNKPNRVQLKGNGLDSCDGDLLNFAASAEYLLYADDTEIDEEEGALTVTDGADTQFTKKDNNGGGNGNGNNGNSNRRNLKGSQQQRKLDTLGSVEVLVVSVGGPDSGYAPPFSDAQLVDDFFTDTASLKTQTEECSKNQFNIIAQADDLANGIQNGVMTIQFPDPIAGINTRDLEANVYAELANRGITINGVVVMCLPELTFQLDTGYAGFGAYAVPNGTLAVFRGSYAERVSTQLHEFGHVYGLKHSGDLIPPFDPAKPKEDTFGDHSGASGGWHSPDDVEMCYNGAKTWQLGWRPTLDIVNTNDQTGLVLTSFADWDPASSEVCIGRIETVFLHFFVHYNRAVGMNAGVQEYGNLVLVSQRSRSEVYTDLDSQLLAALGPGDSFQQDNAGGTGKTMTVTVNSISGSTVNVDVTFTVPSPAPVAPPTPVPTPAPVVPVTPSPVAPCLADGEICGGNNSLCCSTTCQQSGKPNRRQCFTAGGSTPTQAPGGCGASGTSCNTNADCCTRCRRGSCR